MTICMNIQELGMIMHKSENVDMPGAIVTLFSTALLHVIALGGVMVTHCNALAYVVKDTLNYYIC